MASQDWFEKDFYAILGVPQDADAGRDQEGVPQARPQAPPRPERRGHRGRAALQGHRRGQRGPLRPQAARGVRRDPPDGARRRPLPRRWARRRRRFRGRLLRLRRRRRWPARAVLDRRPGRRGARASPTSTTCSRRCSAARPPVASRGGADPFSGFGAPRGPRPGADVQARTTLSFRDAVEGATVTLHDRRGSPDHDQGPRRGQGRPEDPAAGQGWRGRPRCAQGRPHPHDHGREAPGLRPRRRQPHGRSPRHLRRGGARCHRRRPHARRLARAGQGGPWHPERARPARQGPRRPGAARHRRPARQGERRRAPAAHRHRAPGRRGAACRGGRRRPAGRALRAGPGLRSRS